MSQKKYTQLGSLWWMVRFGMQIYPYLIVGCFFVSTLATLFPIATTYITGQILNLVEEYLSIGITTLTSDMIILIVALIAFTAADNITSHFINYFIIRMNYAWDYRAVPKFILKMSQLDFEHIESQNYSLLMHKAKETIDWRGNETIKECIYATTQFTNIITLTGIMVQLNPLFIVMIILPVIFNFLINKRYGNDVYNFWVWQGDTKIHSWHAQHAFEKDDVIREGKIYRFANHIIRRYQESLTIFIQTVTKKMNWKYSFSAIVNILDAILFGIVQLWIVIDILSRRIQIGDGTFYLSSIVRLGVSFQLLESHASRMAEYGPYLTDFRNFMELPSKIKVKKKATKLKHEAPTIEFKNVSFKYPGTGTYVLKDISFTIQAGETVALVGENGAGKTTLIKLLARFYDIEEGAILINGTNIKEIDLDSYYKLWGVLFQSFAKF